jgi:hypothetical protein
MEYHSIDWVRITGDQWHGARVKKIEIGHAEYSVMDGFTIWSFILRNVFDGGAS